MAIIGSNVQLDVKFTKEELETIVIALYNSFAYNREDKDARKEIARLAEKIDPGVTVYFE